MLDSVKNKARQLKEAYEQRAEERREQRKEQELRRAQEKQAALEAEQQQLNAERERLLAMDDKELFVEAILTLRGFYNRIVDLEDQMEDVSASIDSLESELSVIRSRLYNRETDEEEE